MTVPDTLWTQQPFDAFTADDRTALLATASIFEPSAGETIYRCEELSIGSYVILEGRIALSDPLMTTLGGQSATEFATVGTMFSKGSLLQPFAHRHECTAVTDARLLLIGRDGFLDQFELGEGFALKLLEYVVGTASAEVRELNGAIHSVLSEQ